MRAICKQNRAEYQGTFVNFGTLRGSCEQGGGHNQETADEVAVALTSLDGLKSCRTCSIQGKLAKAKCRMIDLCQRSH